jgi:hypothetical protein
MEQQSGDAGGNKSSNPHNEGDAANRKGGQAKEECPPKQTGNDQSATLSDVHETVEESIMDGPSL